MTTAADPAYSHPESVTFKLDLPKAIARFAKDENRFIHTAKTRVATKPFTFELQGDMCTAGINESEFGEGKKKTTSYSIGISLEEPDVEFLNTLTTEFEDFCHAGGITDIDISSPVRDDDRLYLKLKTDHSGKNFNFKTNINVTPKKYSEAANSDKLTFIGEITGWVNLESNKAGLSLTPKRVVFD